MKDTVKVIFKELLSTFPELDGCSDSILEAFNIFKDCYSNNKMVLVCGNGFWRIKPTDLPLMPLGQRNRVSQLSRLVRNLEK